MRTGPNEIAGSETMASEVTGLIRAVTTAVEDDSGNADQAGSSIYGTGTYKGHECPQRGFVKYSVQRLQLLQLLEDY